MEFKIKDKTITDIRKYGIRGPYVMVVSFDKKGRTSFVFGESSRVRLFILQLISNIYNESKKDKLENCVSYIALDNLLSFMTIQLDLLSGDFCKDWIATISEFVNKKISTAVADESLSSNADNHFEDSKIIKNYLMP